MAWIGFSFRIQFATDMTMRRELQEFDGRLQGGLSVAPPDFRQVLEAHQVTMDKGAKLVIRGVAGEETFEEMRVRIMDRIRLPMWPGMVAGLAGFVCFVMRKSFAG
jgi:hypothetical protein